MIHVCYLIYMYILSYGALQSIDQSSSVRDVRKSCLRMASLFNGIRKVTFTVRKMWHTIFFQIKSWGPLKLKIQFRLLPPEKAPPFLYVANDLLIRSFHYVLFSVFYIMFILFYSDKIILRGWWWFWVQKISLKYNIYATNTNPNRQNHIFCSWQAVKKRGALIRGRAAIRKKLVYN